MFSSFPLYRQLDQMDCGPSCLRMIARFYGKEFSLQRMRQLCHIDREGVSLEGIKVAAEAIGMNSLAASMPFESAAPDVASLQEAPLPCVLHWRQRHFVVLYKIDSQHARIADPARGRIKLSRKEFEQAWISHNGEGIVLMLEPTEEFYQQAGDQKKQRSGFAFLFPYFSPYRWLIVQLLLGLLLGSLFQLFFPFLTQAIVDIGIQNQDMGFIYLILLAQLMLFVGQISVNFLQRWILLHIGTRINVRLISDFLSKLMRLPLRFFDVKMMGDLLQRIHDHKRIEYFLTNSALLTLFSFFNLVVFSIVLLIYNFTIFSVFLLGSALYLLWVAYFLHKRRQIDYERFEQLADHQHTLIEMIQGIEEIKMQNSELKRRWKWMDIQTRLFRVNIRSLKITQYQDFGGGFVSQLKDIIISFIAAKAVVDGQITLGMMLAIQFIIGQMNAPLQQMIEFMRGAQDARISLERLGEIHEREEEEDRNMVEQIVNSEAGITIQNLYFRYNQLSDYTLKNVSLHIPEGKVTAIVGTSGSGKTTLIKLLLGFYQPEAGSILVGNSPLSDIGKHFWRSQCGAVLQDGYIFSDSIANNIAESEAFVNKDKLYLAVQTSNVQPFVESLPQAYNTLVGNQGSALSQGQRQRLLIARAVYKNPRYLFLDEATNALDAQNEKQIMQRMDDFFDNKTVVVVAHRLSTVKRAHNIVVLEGGEIVEQGSHQQLVDKQGTYFQLVRDQLELGS